MASTVPTHGIPTFIFQPQVCTTEFSHCGSVIHILMTSLTDVCYMANVALHDYKFASAILISVQQDHDSPLVDQFRSQFLTPGQDIKHRL